MIGKNLAHYEIEALLGSGGMGEVYQAKDARLGRRVALKVLPEAFARDPERIARFEREAKVLASLNHANIAALHGLEEFKGRHFLVMELVEGETLAERIARGPVPAEETLPIAHQITEALEAAHEKGVVHRDLKPANVKITREGRVKVLDFGLAKAMEPSSTNTTLSNSPTLSIMSTNAGVILGTAGYMSPEQARGENVDARSDTFSFGCVLYEMLTGRQAFQGKTVSDVLASVLAREPDLSLLPPSLNPRIPQLLRRAIEKEAKSRWQAIGDVRVEIDGILREGTTLESRASESRPLWKRAIPAVVSSIVLSAITGMAVWSLRPSLPANVVTRFSLTLPEGQRFTNVGRSLIAISPDGTRIVYVADRGLHLRSMHELDASPIRGTEGGAVNPAFSPDGQSIVYFSASDNALKRISVVGGAAVTICPAENPFGMHWTVNDEILFGQSKGIMRVPAKGGTPELLVARKPDESADRVQMLPDGKTILFTQASLKNTGQERHDKAQIIAHSLSTGERKVLIEGGSDGRYIPTDHIVYALGGTLLAVPFDLARLEVTGGPVPILEGIMRGENFQASIAQFAFSDTGSLVYIPGASSPPGIQRSMFFADRNGQTKELGLPPGPYDTPRISPNGKQVAFVMDDGKEQTIWIYDLSGTASMRRLTFGGQNRFPIWSTDSQRVIFESNRDGGNAMFSQRADGSGTAERLSKAPDKMHEHPISWQPNSERFLFGLNNGQVNFGLSVFSIPDKKAEVFAEYTMGIGRGVFSPDGRWIAYASNETGTAEVFVRPYPATGAKYLISKGGGNNPLWAPAGKELFYTTPDNKLVAVSIATKPSFSFGNASPIPIAGNFQTGFVRGLDTGYRNFDIMPDGKQFLIILPKEAADPTTLQIQVVLNWFSELQQRVPVK